MSRAANGAGHVEPARLEASVTTEERAAAVVTGAARPVASGASAPVGADVRAGEPSRPLVGVAVLAAGHARRFGANKLLAPFQGEPVLARTLTRVPGDLPMVAASATPEVDALCQGRGATVVRPENPLQSGSVRALARYAEQQGWDGCLFLPGDQPLVTPESLRALLAAFGERPQACARLAWEGAPASPVVFPVSLFGRLRGVEGDRGGASALGPSDEVVLVEAAHPWELWDVDTPADLERVREVAR